MKKLLPLIMSAALIMGLTGCGRQETAQTNTENTSASNTTAETSEVSEEKIPLTIWTDFTPRSESLFREAMNAFVAENPEYVPNFEIFPGADRAQKLALAKQSNTLPTLMFAASFTMLDQAHQGGIVPITEVMEPIASDYSQSIHDATIINGESYMFPIYQSPFVLFYNADMFREAGLEKFVTESADIPAEWTLDELENQIFPALKELFAGTEKYPMTLFAGNDQADTNNHSWLRMYGGTVFADGKVVAGENENTIRALDTLAGWVESGYTNSDAATKLGTEALVDFQNQLAAICWGNQINFENLKNSVKEGKLEDFDFRIVLIPQDTTQTMAMYYYGGFLMNVDEKQQEGGKKFLSWLSQQKDTYLKDLSLLCMPSSLSVLEALGDERPIYQEYQKRDNYVYDFTGAVPGYVETRALFFPAIQSKLSGKQSSADALMDYQNAANKIIEEYSKRSVALN